jgi:hypothetical protein
MKDTMSRWERSRRRSEGRIRAATHAAGTISSFDRNGKKWALF